MNKHKKFIKKAYKGELGLKMCQDWKDLILENYPEFKEEDFKVGDWIQHKQHKPGSFLFCYGKHYGFDRGFDWNEGIEKYCSISYINKNYRKATPKEIEQHLIQEAERRYNVPCKVQYLDSGIGSLQGYSLVYDIENDTLGASGSGCRDFIYKKGQWAEIINTMTKEEAEAKLNCKIVD